MRRIYKPGRSNVLANNAMVATSQPLSSQEAINYILPKTSLYWLLTLTNVVHLLSCFKVGAPT